jgi:hypothetical protein
MPDFSRAEIATTSADLSAYTSFLRKVQVGQTITLPLDPGETPRTVMRAVNSAASQLGVRLARLPSDQGVVRFRVISPEKRQIQISEEAKRARVEKARTTRAARASGRNDAGEGMATPALDAPANSAPDALAPEASEATAESPAAAGRRPRKKALSD